MRNRRSPFVLLLLLFFGALAGGLVGEFLSRFAGFEWISFGGVNGYKPLVSVSLNPLIDVRVLRFGFNFALDINAGSILGMGAGIFIYARL